LGMSTSGGAVAPTGIPLGAAPLATPGVSSGFSSGVASATACSSPGMGSAMTGTSGSTALFDSGGVGIMTGATLPGAAAAITTTCGFRNGQPLVLAVEHFDACELATGRPDDSHGFNRTEQSGPQPGALSGNGQHGAVNVFRCLLMRKRLQESMQCDARSSFPQFRQLRSPRSLAL